MLSKKYADVTDGTIQSAMTQNCKDLRQSKDSCREKQKDGENHEWHYKPN